MLGILKSKFLSKANKLLLGSYFSVVFTTTLDIISSKWEALAILLSRIFILKM